MNRRQFAQSCRDIAKRLGFMPMVQPWQGRLFDYSDSVLYISSRDNGAYLNVEARDAKLKKSILRCSNGELCFSKHWKRYAEHVARLTVLDQLAQL